MIYRFTILLLFFFVLISSFKIPIEPSPKLHVLSGKAQGTSFLIKYIHLNEVINRQEIDSIFTIFEFSLSRYNKTSFLSQLNLPKRRAKIDSHLYKVLSYSKEMQSATNGCFDYRLMTLIHVWGFGSAQKSSIPDTNKIYRLLKQMNSSNIEFNNLIAKKSSRNLKIDLDGIAQGYCVDELSNFLKNRGIKDYVVELGGEIVISGTDLDKSSWEIGLGEQHEEFTPTKQSLVLTGMNQMAITSSGSLQKFKKIGNQYFSHIIDPRTGFPVQNGILSVTVIAPSAMQADALDNAFMVMGIKDSFEWCKKYSNIGFYMTYINPNGELVDTANANFKQFLKINNRN